MKIPHDPIASVAGRIALRRRRRSDHDHMEVGRHVVSRMIAHGTRKAEAKHELVCGFVIETRCKSSRRLAVAGAV